MPSAQSCSQNKNLVSTSVHLLENRNWTFPKVHYFTWKLEFVSNILWMIVVGLERHKMKRSIDENKDHIRFSQKIDWDYLLSQEIYKFCNIRYVNSNILISKDISNILNFRHSFFVSNFIKGKIAKKKILCLVRFVC